jgi:DNA-binding LytR/AlgR family response regulator
MVTNWINPFNTISVLTFLNNDDMPFATGKNISDTGNDLFRVSEVGIKRFRFEDKNKSYLWVCPDQILFIKSADHYVKSLVLYETQATWTIRHSTIKDLMFMLPRDSFIRLNKFYALNRRHFSYYDEVKKLLYFKDGYSIPISHRISRFVIDALIA